MMETGKHLANILLRFWGLFITIYALVKIFQESRKCLL